MNIMETNEKGFTGYSHIDKPWEKYYPDNNYKMYSESVNIARYIRDKNVGRERNIAQTYYGRKYTYKDFFECVDNASRLLTKLGVKCGETIMFLMPNIPETGHLWFGAAQIGAISDFIDPRPDSMNYEENAKKVLNLLKEENAKYIVSLDQCYQAMLNPIEKEIKDLGIETIILISASDSMSLIGKFEYLRDVAFYRKLDNKKSPINEKVSVAKCIIKKISNMKLQESIIRKMVDESILNIVRYKEESQLCRDINFVEVNDENLVSYIGHTSGTCGSSPKPIPLTNKNLIFASESVFKLECNVRGGERILHELPFFSPLGGHNNFVIDLASGANLIDIPEFDISEFGYLIKKVHPNAFMGTPSWLHSLVYCDYLKPKDLKNVRVAIYGGDSMSEREERELVEWFQKNGSKAEVQKGHGMSEFCGGGTYARSIWNCYESIGIPLPDVTYGIVDPEEDELVPMCNKDDEGFIRGELVVSSDAVTVGMLNGKTIVPHFFMDGKEYIRTGDLVKMREDGVFFFETRKNRAFTRFDGYKVKPVEIEREIEQLEIVKKCIVSHYYDDSKKGNMPTAIIVPKNEIYHQDREAQILFVKTIIDECFIKNSIMTSRQIPSKFRFLEYVPLTKNSKVDYNAIFDVENDLDAITVCVEENNLNVGEVKIF